MKRFLAIAALAAFPFSATATPLGPFSDFFVFGDSLSDAGNAFLGTGGTTPPNPPYPDGQFTNGDTWATQLGALPSLAGGQNYAVGGAKALPDADPSPDLAAQIGIFLSDAPVLGANPLAAILIGANDIKTATSIPEALVLINAVMGEIASGIATLTANGIEQVAVMGLPNLGRFPGVVGTPEQGFATAGSLLFNDLLRDTADAFGTDALYVDLFAPLEAVFALPGDYGITNTTEACLATPVACLAGDPDSYFFYDDVHPTEPVHSVIAGAFYDAVTAPVPLPAGGVLMASSLAGLALRQARRLPWKKLSQTLQILRERCRTMLRPALPGRLNPGSNAGD